MNDLELAANQRRDDVDPYSREATTLSPRPCRSGGMSARWRKVMALSLWMILSAITWWIVEAQAQEPLRREIPQHPAPIVPSLPQERPSPTLPRPELPPIPRLSDEPQRLPLPRLLVRQIKVIGHTVFTDEELEAVTAAYVNRAVTSEELEALRLALTRLYVDAGYVNSGVVLPDQTVTEGIVTFKVIEGSLTNVVISGNRWFRSNYLRSRLTLDVETPLNIEALEEGLQRLGQDDRIERLEAELRPGAHRGEGEFYVHVQERLPFFVALEFNNYQSPNIGAERGLITIAHRNLTGHGDIMRFTFWRSAGLNLQVDTSYTVPVSPRDTTMSLRYQRTDSSVIEDQFDPLDVKSESEIVTLTLRHPVYRTRRNEFALELEGEHLRSQTTLLGMPFSFSLGAEDGETIDTALRFTAEWVDRTPRQVLAIRSRLSLGIDALGATINADADLPDGRFLNWLGQFQWGQRLGGRDLQLFFRLDVQLSTEPLLPLEQIAIGGRFTVRGYRENTIVRDNGLVSSVEMHIPLLRNRRWAEFLRVVPFVDVGRGWNRKVATPDPENLASIGLGVEWSATWGTTVPLRAHAEVFWGYPLLDVPTSGGDLQDRGLHLQLVLSAF